MDDEMTDGERLAAAFVGGILELPAGRWGLIRGVCWDPANVVIADGTIDLWPRQDETAVSLTMAARLCLAGKIDGPAVAQATILIQLAAIEATASQSPAAPRSTERYGMAEIVMRQRATPVAGAYARAASDAVRLVGDAELRNFGDDPAPWSLALAFGTWMAIRKSAEDAAQAMATPTLPADARAVLVSPFTEAMPWLG